MSEDRVQVSGAGQSPALSPAQGLAVERSSSLLLYVARALAPEAGERIVVRHDPVRDGVVSLSVTVPTESLGRVIGRGGRTAGALRTVVGALAQRSGLAAKVSFSDGTERRRGGSSSRGRRGGASRPRRR
jgi:predicted RNA-binding protein YlqC (UPF0109 family)